MEDKTMIFVISVIDWGLELNKAFLGRAYFKPGEIVQAHVMILGSHVWIERNKPLGLWRVAFGESPELTELVTFDQAKKQIEEYFLCLVQVIP
jgi:hypothetical protein